MYAYAHTLFDEETIELTSFSSGEKQFAFIRGFYGLKRVRKFFIKQMSSFFSKHTQNKRSLSFTLTTFYYSKTLKNICSNLLNNPIL